MIKVHVIRTTTEASNPLCSAPFVVQAFQGARLSDGGPWTDLADLRQEQVDVNNWAFFCRGMENMDLRAKRSDYRLVQVDGKRRLEVPSSFDLEGMLISDASSWADWTLLLKANRWIADMRTYQLRSGSLHEPTRRGPRLSVLYTVAIAVALIEHQPESVIDQELSPYLQSRVSSPLSAAHLGKWVKP